MTNIASLDMYDMPSTRQAFDDLWSAVRQRLLSSGIRDVPLRLSHDLDLEEIWRSSDLLIAQTCGYPLLKTLSDRVRLVATPVYAFPGCDGAWHRSFIVVRRDSPYQNIPDLHNCRAALNGGDSNSGMNLFRAMIAPFAEGRPFFGSVDVTGSHRASLAAVAGDQADVASIDCVSYALITREQPVLEGTVRILAETPASPSLPLVTRAEASDNEVSQLRDALSVIRSAKLAEVRATLALEDFAILDLDDYRIIAEYEAEAIRLGYPALA